MIFTSDYVIAHFDEFGMVFCNNTGELSFAMMTLAMSNRLDKKVTVLHELGGYSICNPEKYS